MQVTLHSGIEDLEVVGESSYQDALWAVVGRTSDRVRTKAIAMLVPEDGNPYDPNATSVWIEGNKVGYLSREDAAALRPAVIQKMVNTGQAVAFEAVIAGGGARQNGREGLLGVWLEWDPTDFGLAARRTVEAPALRTGLGSAIETDLADQSYDLSWVSRLPEDGPRRLKMLRSLLNTEQEPFSRHYVFAQLEKDLYAYREVLPGALDEYDEVTAQHDAQMDSIRPALLAKFGSLPLLETYRQASIRHAKSGGNLDRALWWAKRGRELYGNAAHDQEWVLDLDKRIGVLEARIAKRDAPKSERRTEPRVAQVRTGGIEEGLVCQKCGRSFMRLRTRGRKPLNCPDCRAA